MQMNRFFLCIAVLFSAVRLSAEDPSAVLDSFIGRVASSAVGFSYSYVMDDGRAKVTGKGTVSMQGDSYLIRGNGLEIYCDGRTRWTVDSAAMEAVAETCSPENPDYTVNPAVLLKHFDKAFSLEQSGILPDGSLRYLLSPVSSSGISSLEMVLSQDGNSLLSAVLRTKEEATVSFTIASFTFSRASDPSRFIFDPSTLASGYIITDLR